MLRRMTTTEGRMRLGFQRLPTATLRIVKWLSIVPPVHFVFGSACSLCCPRMQTLPLPHKGGIPLACLPRCSCCDPCFHDVCGQVVRVRSFHGLGHLTRPFVPEKHVPIPRDTC